MDNSLSHNPPFRAEHIGSLLRPDSLLEMRQRHATAEIDKNELTQAEDAAIRDIVAIELKLGFRSISDGEYRRSMFWGDFYPNLQGFTSVERPEVEIYRTYMPNIEPFIKAGQRPPESVFCTGKIKHIGSAQVDQWRFIKTLVPEALVKGCKVTMPAPELYHMRYKEGAAYPASIYATDEEFFADIANAYETEIRILYDNGVRNVQVDDPNLTYFCDEKMLASWTKDRANKKTADQALDQYIDLYNDCFSKRPSDLHIGVHMCRGNFRDSRHFSEGGYERVAQRLFNRLNVDTFYLEYDTPRAGGFAPLKDLPKNKNVILGVITSKFPQLEPLEDLKARVLEAADIIAAGNGEKREDALKRMGVSPQCGFASHPAGNALTRDDMIRKLQLVRQLADAIWPGEP